MKKTIAVLLSALTISGLAAGSASAAEPRNVTVGAVPSNAGTSFLDKDGKLTGYEIEVLNEVDRRLPEYTFSYKTMDFGSLFAALSTKKVDLITCNLQYSPERAKKYLFTNEKFYATAYKLSIKQDNKSVKSFQDLKGKKISVLGTGLQYPVLKDYIEKNNLDIEILPGKLTAEVVNLLNSKRADAAFLPEFQVYAFTRHADANLKALGKGFIPYGVKASDVGARFLFRKDETKLRDQIDAKLVEMRKDGTLKKLSFKWFGVDLTQPLNEKDLQK